MGYCIRKAVLKFKASIIILLIIGQCFIPEMALAFSIKDEVELGKKFNVLIRSRLPIVQDPEVVQYMDDLIKRLASAMPPQPVPFTPAVVRSDSVNAFATPGGYVFAFSGLIVAMSSESELAAVMAHELAHVTQRHIARRMENAQTLGILSALGMLAGAFLGGDVGAATIMGSAAATQSAMLSYSRSDENEADQVGLNYLIKAGYNPYGMPKAFEVLSRRQWLLGASIPTYLSTHPDLKDRIYETKARIDRLPDKIRNQDVSELRFKRIQTILRARYSDPQASQIHFQQELSSSNKCLALMGLGIIASKENRVTDAANFFDKAISCSPDDQLIIRESGRFHYTKGNKNKGHDLLQTAVSKKRDDVMALFYLARSQADKGQTSMAIENMRYILRYLPENSDAHFFIARFYGQQRDLFKANLHMAYSGLYKNDKRTVDKFFNEAKALANNPSQRSDVMRFENTYKERSEYW